MPIKMLPTYTSKSHLYDDKLQIVVEVSLQIVYTRIYYCYN